MKFKVCVRPMVPNVMELIEKEEAIYLFFKGGQQGTQRPTCKSATTS